MSEELQEIPETIDREKALHFLRETKKVNSDAGDRTSGPSNKSWSKGVAKGLEIAIEFIENVK